MKRYPDACVAVLAAGTSKRMGTCKLLMPFAGSTLLDRALVAASGAGAAETVVVTGAYREDVAAAASAYGVREVHNADWGCGQSSSVRLAAHHAAARGCDALVLAVADQPYLEARHIEALLEAHEAGAEVCVSVAGGRQGNPCAFDARCFPLLERLTGDEGARALLRSRPDLEKRLVCFDDVRLFDDVDTPDDARRIEKEVLDGRFGQR